MLRSISLYVHADAITPAGPSGAVALLARRRRLSPILKRVSPCITRFEACSAFTRVPACTLAKSPVVTRYIEGFNDFVTSIAAPTATSWSDQLLGGTFTH